MKEETAKKNHFFLMSQKMDAGAHPNNSKNAGFDRKMSIDAKLVLEFNYFRAHASPATSLFVCGRAMSIAGAVNLRG